MKSRFSIFAVLAFAFAMLVSTVSAATLNVVESGKSYTVTGARGCTVSGATVATPSVITCVAAHNLADGDPIQITGVGGTTTDNTVGYAKRTGYSATTFGFYTDAGLATGVTGTGSYTSGGVVTAAYDISGVTGDWTLRLRFDALTAAKKTIVLVQQSSDGFVSDVQTLLVVNPLGALGQGNGNTAEYSVRSYQLPSAKFGTSNERIRVKVDQIDSSTTALIDLFLEN